MTNGDANRILRAIEKLDGKVDSTREEAAETRAQVKAEVKGLGRWITAVDAKLDRQEERHSKLAQRVASVETSQKECPARLRATADATGQRPAMQSESAIQATRVVEMPPIGQSTPSIRPEHRRALLWGGGGVGGGLIVLILVLIIAKLVGVEIPLP